MQCVKALLIVFIGVMNLPIFACCCFKRNNSESYGFFLKTYRAIACAKTDDEAIEIIKKHRALGGLLGTVDESGYTVPASQGNLLYATVQPMLDTDPKPGALNYLLGVERAWSNILDCQDMSPLHYAVREYRWCRGKKYLQCVELLLQHDADPNIKRWIIGSTFIYDRPLDYHTHMTDAFPQELLLPFFQTGKALDTRWYDCYTKLHPLYAASVAPKIHEALKKGIPVIDVANIVVDYVLTPEPEIEREVNKAPHCYTVPSIRFVQ